MAGKDLVYVFTLVFFGVNVSVCAFCICHVLYDKISEI